MIIPPRIPTENPLIKWYLLTKPSLNIGYINPIMAEKKIIIKAVLFIRCHFGMEVNGEALPYYY